MSDREAFEWAINVLTEAKEIFEAQADCIDPSLMDVAHRCFCAIKGLHQAQSGDGESVNQQLLELLKQAASYTRHSDYDWDMGFIRDVDAAIAAAQERGR